MIPARPGVKNFQIKVDLSKVYKKIQDCKVREFSGSTPIIELTAKNPDGAAHNIYNNLLSLLQDTELTDREIDDVMNKMSIISIREKRND